MMLLIMIAWINHSIFVKFKSSIRKDIHFYLYLSLIYFLLPSFKMSKKTIVNTTTNLLLRIHVRPNAKNNAIREINSNNELRIDIAADAQDGKANHELIDYIKTILKISSNQLEILHGHKQRDKVLRIITTPDNQNNLIERLRNEIT